jgi:hypothetical protein
MKYGIELGACGACGDPRALAHMARFAEDAGYDKRCHEIAGIMRAATLQN